MSADDKVAETNLIVSETRGVTTRSSSLAKRGQPCKGGKPFERSHTS